MKNKSTMLLVGIGVAYLLYRLYAKKSMAPVKTTSSAMPNLLYSTSNQIETNEVPRQFLVDDVRTAEVPDTPSTYQTFYGSARLTGYSNKVPSTC